MSSCSCSTTITKDSSTNYKGDGNTSLPGSGQNTPLTNESVLEAMSILRSALDSDQKDSNTQSCLLNAALENTQATYEALMKKSPEELTDDMREVIRLYQQASNLVGDVLSECAPELMDHLSLFNEIMCVPQEDRTEVMNRFVALFLEIMQSLRDNATTLSALGFKAQMSELKLMADQIKAEGYSAYCAGMVRGGLAIGGGLVAGICGGVSVRKQGRVTEKSPEVEHRKFELKKCERAIARKDAELENIRNSKEYAAGDPDAIDKAKNCRNEIERLESEEVELTGDLNTKSRELDKLNNSAGNWMMGGRTVDPISGALGGMIGSEFDRQASEDRAQQTEHQANATAAEQNKELGEKLFGSADNTAASVLQAYREIGQSEAEAYKAVAHA